MHTAAQLVLTRHDSCAVRVFTTIQEGGGASMLAGYTVGLLLNATMLAQIVLYGSGSGSGAGKAGGSKATARRRVKQA